MRFGMYLMRRGVISAEQLVDALEEQADRQPPLGQIAIEEGALSVRDVFEVLRAQSESSSNRFGDVAMERGLLTRRQIADLLMLQADRVRPLSEILIDLGAVDPAIVEAELEAYRRDRERDGATRGDQSHPATDVVGPTSAEPLPEEYLMAEPVGVMV